MPTQAQEILLQFNIALHDRGDVAQAKKLMEDYDQASGRSINTLKAMEKQLNRLGDTARETGARFKELGQRADEIQNLGNSIRQMGYALQQTGESFFSKQKQGIDDYVRAYGNVNTVSAKYNESLKAIDAANTRIGSLGAAALIPQMQAQAAAAQQWAGFLEKYPAISGFSANIGQIVQNVSGAVAQAGGMASTLGGLINLPTEMEKAGKQFGELWTGASRMLNDALTGDTAKAAATAATQVEAAAAQEDAATKNLAAATGAEGSAASTAVEKTASFSSSELANSLHSFQTGEMAAAAAQESAAAEQSAAAATQTTAAAAQATSGLEIGKALFSFGGALSVFGGVVAGLAVSDFLANSGANKSDPVKGLNDAISGATGGIGGFQFQSITQVGTMLGQLFTIWAMGIGVMLNTGLDFIHGINKAFADVQVNITRAVGNLFPGNLGDKAANNLKAAFTAMGAYSTRTVDFVSQFGLAAGQLAGVIPQATTGAEQAAEAWPQALDAYVQFSKQSQEAEQSYNIERTRTINENQRQEMLNLANFEHQKQRSIEEFNRQDILQSAQRAHQISTENLEIAHQRQTAAVQLDHTRQLEDADRQHQITKQLEQFNYQESITETQYYKQRLLAARDYGIQMEEAEYQYQTQAIRDLQDHDDRVLMLGKQNDAMGIVLEMRQYEKDRNRKAEDFNHQTGKSNSDFARQQADQERQFAYDRQLRLEEMKRNQAIDAQEVAYRRQVQDADIKYQHGVEDKETQYKRDRAEHEYQWDRARRAQDFLHQQDIAQQEFDREKGITQANNAIRLGEMQNQYDRETKKRTLQFEDQLNQLDGALLGETKQRDAYYKIMGDNLKTWMKDQVAMISGAGTGEYKAPTYVRPGDTSQINNPNVVFLPGIGVVSNTGNGGRLKGRAEGGYAKFGKYTLGEHGDEFVVKADATKQLEHILGQRLTQEGLLAAVTGQRAASSFNANMAQHFTFNGMPNGAQSQDLVNSIRQAVMHDMTVSLRRAASLSN